MVRIFFVGVFLFLGYLCFPVATFAAVPLVVAPETVNDIRTIEEPEVEQLFFSDLNNFPQMYRIVAEEPFTLSLEVRVPKIEQAQTIIHGIVLRQLHRGGVEEITRLMPNDVVWEDSFDIALGESYLRGPSFETELPAGEYLIEMSTPDNDMPYIMKIGYAKGNLGVGYVEMLGRIKAVKTFYGHSAFALITSAYMYVPLLCFLLLASVGALGIRRHFKKVVPK